MSPCNEYLQTTEYRQIGVHYYVLKEQTSSTCLNYNVYRTTHYVAILINKY